MAAKIEVKADKIERTYVIPLRKKVKVVPRYKKANKAIKTIREFVARHMKIRDRDLKKIKVDEYVNEVVWARGIKKPPSKIKVKVTKSDDDIVQVWLVDYPKKLKFKKQRADKKTKEAEEADKKKKADAKAVEEAAKKEAEEKKKEVAETTEEAEEKKAEEKEKKSAVVEAGVKMEKAAAKKAKHVTGGKTKQPKHQQRKALAK
ncbi:MAG: 50S ribosomal protein L31e [Candidatus Nanoarchaeia archaeon]